MMDQVLYTKMFKLPLPANKWAASKTMVPNQITWECHLPACNHPSSTSWTQYKSNLASNRYHPHTTKSSWPNVNCRILKMPRTWSSKLFNLYYRNRKPVSDKSEPMLTLKSISSALRCPGLPKHLNSVSTHSSILTLKTTGNCICLWEMKIIWFKLMTLITIELITTINVILQSQIIFKKMPEISQIQYQHTIKFKKCPNNYQKVVKLSTNHRIRLLPMNEK